MSGKLIVVSGAELKCSQGEGKSYLRSTHASTVSVEGKYPATIKDHKAGDNIPPFKYCKILKGDCKPNLPAPWQDNIFSGLSLSLPGAQDLSPTDQLHCTHTGIIEIVSSCQSTVLVGGPPEPEIRLPERPHASSANFTPEQMKASDEEWNRKRFGDDAPRAKLSDLAGLFNFFVGDDARKIIRHKSLKDVAEGGLGFVKVGKVLDAFRGAKRLVRSLKKAKKGYHDIDRGHQDTHIIGRAHKDRPTHGRTTPRTPWSVSAAEADRLTLQAYKYGRVVERYPDGSPKKIVRQMVHPVGGNGERRITVRVNKKGKIVGYPSGPKSK